MGNTKSKKYNAQALAIAMVILVVSSLIGVSIYSRVMKDTGLTLEERASAEALEVSDVILDRLSQYSISSVVEGIIASEELSEFNYDEGIVLRENSSSDDITRLLKQLNALETDSISDLIDPLCPVSDSSNEYELTLKESDEDTYYEVKPGNVWSLPAQNLLEQDSCGLDIKLAIRGDSRAGFVLSRIYLKYDDDGNLQSVKDYGFSDTLNYCFSSDGATCNNPDFLDTDNWIKYNPDEDGELSVIIGTRGSENGFALDYGTGADGDCTISSDTNINTQSCVGRTYGDAISYSVSSEIERGSNSIDLGTTPLGLSSGDEILIINLQGTSTDYSDVGKYESANILSINGTTLFLSKDLENTYDGTTQKVVVQRIPQYVNVTVNGGATWTSSEWNGSTGGVMVFRATTSVNIAGTVEVSGKGYLGGTKGVLSSSGGGAGESVFENVGLGGYGGYNSSVNGNDGVSSGGGAAGKSGTSASGSVGDGESNIYAGGGGGGGTVNYYQSTSYRHGFPGAGGGGGYATPGLGGGGYEDGIDGSNGISGAGSLAGYLWVSGQPRNIGGAGGGGAGGYGDASLQRLYFGSGGGGSGAGQVYTGPEIVGSDGGNGGGIIIIFGREVNISGEVQADGEEGESGAGAGGGGGAGGSIKIAGMNVSLGENIVTASGGGGGLFDSSYNVYWDHDGGDGGKGRLAIFYSDSLTGSVDEDAYIEEMPILGELGDYRLGEVRVKAISGTIGVSYSLPTECITGFRMYQLRVTANCSGVYRGKEIIIPEAKWYNVLFDYVLFNGEGSM